MSTVRKISLFREEHGTESAYSGWRPYGVYDRTWWSFAKIIMGALVIITALCLVAVPIAFGISAADRRGCQERWIGFNTSHSMFGGCVVEVAPGEWLPESKVNRGDFHVEVSQ